MAGEPQRSDSPGERRAFSRYAVWFPVTVYVDGDEFGAICRDAGAGGLLISSARPLPVGARATLNFRVSVKATTDWRLDAEVVRAEANQGDMLLAFPFRLGFRFTSPVAELPKELSSELGVDEGT